MANRREIESQVTCVLDLGDCSDAQLAVRPQQSGVGKGGLVQRTPAGEVVAADESAVLGGLVGQQVAGLAVRVRDGDGVVLAELLGRPADAGEVGPACCCGRRF